MKGRQEYEVVPIIDHEAEMDHISKPIELEVEHVKKPVVAEENYTSSQVKHYTRRVTRSQTEGRGKLSDVLKAIEIEENPIVHSFEIKEAETKKKNKRAKKLDLTQEYSGFIFKPIKPITRS